MLCLSALCLVHTIVDCFAERGWFSCDQVIIIECVLSVCWQYNIQRSERASEKDANSGFPVFPGASIGTS